MSEEKLGAIRQRRAMRAYQAKHRGSGEGYVTRLENAAIVVAWESGALSEGQAARALGVDRLSARLLRDDLIVLGVDVCEATR